MKLPDSGNFIMCCIGYKASLSFYYEALVGYAEKIIVLLAFLYQYILVVQ